MKSVIVGTAGHIDHGKTALVKALTGIDADRLEEEKRRGITIDIGFAHLELPAPGGEALRLGFVDVPGHERFVRNMLAGVGGIDLVLLVIAADESIKPQTREHFDICRLLSVRRGITVLTKADLVDRDTREVVGLEVEDFLRGSFLDSAQSPIVTVSSRTGAGMDELRQALAEVASRVPAKDSTALARLPIDRVFTMRGFGTVVTGTLISGAISKEEELEVFPGAKRVRVRGVQVHGSPAEQAVAGQRTALNLAGAALEDLRRGMTLAPPNIFALSQRVDAILSLLPSAKPLKDAARVHFHSYTHETLAQARLLGAKQLNPGAEQFVELRLAEPTLLLPGDRFILRQFSPVITIGGGMVLDRAPRAKWQKDLHESFLRTVVSGDREATLLARIRRRGDRGLSLPEAVAETGWRSEWIEKSLSAFLEKGTVLRAGELLVEAEFVDRAKLLARQTVADFHARNPLVPGISKEALREKLGLSVQFLSLVLDKLTQEKKIEVIGELIRSPGRGVVMKDEEAESKKSIEDAFASAGLKVPFLRDVLAGLKVDKARAQQIVTLLLRDKILIKLSDELVFHRSALEGLRRQVEAYKTKAAKIDVGKFKDMTGVSRKYAIPLLEYLDREHVTRRVGDERVIL